MRISNLFLGALLSVSFAGAHVATAGVELVHLSDGWATQLLQDTARLEETQPALAASIRSANPRLSRSGAPLFIEPDWRSPEAASAILVRVAEGSDSPEARVGLLDALTRTEGEWHPAVVGLLAHEASPTVRRMMVEILRLAPAETASAGVQLGIQDQDAEVRAAALRVIGGHKQGAQMAALAVQALNDDDARVREEAARSIGYTGHVDGFEALRDRLSDADPAVRFRSLRSLEKLDLDRATQLTELQSLATDPDVKVAREAQQLLLR